MNPQRKLGQYLSLIGEYIVNNLGQQLKRSELD
jgi:hypothetical protein